MPHIRIGEFDPSIFPFRHGDVEFLWYAGNLEHANEGLIGVEVADVPFLLQVKREADSALIKAEKISRPSPNTLIKKALQAYLDRVGPPLIYANIAGIERAKLQKPHPCLKEIGTFDSDKLPDKPLWVEVGFGSGRHLIHQAKNRPDVHLIGLEIHRPSLEQVMRRIDLEQLDNVWVIDYDARLFLELLPSNRVQRIFVHFPVPWDKKPHRRVISDAFVAEASRVLEPGGTLELRTDSENYFHYAMEVFTRPRKVRLSLEKNADAAVKSKYEERWLRLRKDIYEIRFESLERSPCKRTIGAFDFCSRDLAISELFKRKPSKANVAEGYFVHLERFYAIDERRGLVRVSLGSFDRPEHKYLFLSDEGANYYPHKPVATGTNLKAHHALKEWLCATS